MAKRPSEGSSADRTFRSLRPQDFTNPDAAPGEKPAGKAQWASVKARQAGGNITLTPEELTDIIREATTNSAQEKGTIKVKGA
jgi:hypothetical protein